MIKVGTMMDPVQTEMSGPWEKVLNKEVVTLHKSHVDTEAKEVIVSSKKLRMLKPGDTADEEIKDE